MRFQISESVYQTNKFGLIILDKLKQFIEFNKFGLIILDKLKQFSSILFVSEDVLLLFGLIFIYSKF